MLFVAIAGGLALGIGITLSLDFMDTSFKDAVEVEEFLGLPVVSSIAYIENNDIDTDGLMQFVKGPDFPTGGTIYGVEGIKSAYETGKGRVVIRAKAHFESEDGERERIIISEIPYQVNKATTIQKISQLITDKKLEGIADVNDESDRDGMRIVVDLKRDANPKVVLNKLYQMTPLQSSFSINNVALVKGRPYTLNLKDLIRHFVDHRHEVIVRRTQYELEEAQKRAHILEGLLIALDHLDEVIALIRASQTADEARTGLMERFSLSEIQAKAILDMRLQRLTGLEREKLQEQYRELKEKIDYYESVLADETLRMTIIKDELGEMKAQYGGDRRTDITFSAGEIRIEDIIANEDVVLTVSNQGYIKRTPVSEYQSQGRGGKGFRGAGRKETDFVEHLFIARTHNYLMFFTEKGRCYWIKVYELPEGERTHKGRAIQNIIQIDPSDSVKTFMTVEGFDDEDFVNNHAIIMVTKKGQVKKTPLKEYSRPRTNGINAITINEGDELLEAKLTDGKSEIVLGTKSGYAIRFNEANVREMGRTAAGVRGISLQGDDDEVVGMIVVNDETQNILVISEKGYGKQSPVSEYRLIGRGGKGVKNLNVTDKTGKVVAIKLIESEDEDVMIITRQGNTVRIPTTDITIQGRNTQGVTLIRLRDGDEIASVAKVAEKEEEEDTSGEAPASAEE